MAIRFVSFSFSFDCNHFSLCVPRLQIGSFQTLAKKRGEMQPNQKENFYNEHAESYEQLISREDHQNNIDRVLTELRPCEGLDVLDLGAGTGMI